MSDRVSPLPNDEVVLVRAADRRVEVVAGSVLHGDHGRDQRIEDEREGRVRDEVRGQGELDAIIRGALRSELDGFEGLDPADVQELVRLELARQAAEREAAEAEPENRFRAAYRVRGAEHSLSLWALARWTSATYWAAYAGVEADSEGLYSERIPSRWELDLSLRKSLLQRRAHVGMTFRNLLDREVRLHPIGAGWDLAFFVHADVVLGRPEAERR